MKRKAEKEKTRRELVEELKRILKEPDSGYDDLPDYVPLKKGQVVVTFIKKGRKKWRKK
jgi:hypothetical protein